MSSATASPAVQQPPGADRKHVERRAKARTSLLAHGEPMVWLTGGMLALALAMIVGLLALIVVQGAAAFWPGKLVKVQTYDNIATGQKGEVYLGEVTDRDTYQPPADAAKPLGPEAAKKLEESGTAERRQFRTANFDLAGTHYTLVSDFEIEEETEPEWAMVVERLDNGRFHGFPTAFLEEGQVVATDEAEILAKYNEHHAAVLELGRRRWRLQKIDLGAILAKVESARKATEQAEKERGKSSPEAIAAAKQYAETQGWAAEARKPIDEEIEDLRKQSDRYKLRLTTADGKTKDVPVADIVRLYPANQLGFWGKLGVALSRWWEFLTDQPREANSAGGVWPAIWGTVAMTMVMTLVVVPFGVLAALYLREYAKAGPIVSAVRIAINNLAGVPSIVFGMFGLVFFCYILGGGIDNLFYGGNMTFRKGALVWAALTLALLTLPVVIVASEEALAAVPNSMREGSYACGASKWQTIRRIVLPRALPGVLTGMILAIARGAGEVAPIMLVGAVKIAPELPVDGVFPYVHPQRSFMHLGFHIFDLGFQSQNSEAAKPMVFTTTLLLITIIAILNIAAVWLRTRLRRRFLSSAF
jgi:phosphate transport system permease protein